MDYEDEIPTATRAVRSYMATGGKVRVERGRILPLETLVGLTDLGRAGLSALQFERRSLAELCHTQQSIAELASKMGLPMRATQVLVSEMVASGAIAAASTIANADVDMLVRIRAKIVSL